MNKKVKNILFITVILLFISWIIFSLYLYFSWFSFQVFFSDTELSLNTKIAIVLLIYFFRNYLFVPSTVIILFTWYFLEIFWISLIVSLIWVSIWIFQTYFVWYLFKEELKNKKDFKLISKYSDKIEQNWFKVIFTWAFFPVIPLDILYYSAWFVKFNFFKAYLAWITWEFTLIVLYTYLGDQADIYSKYLSYIFIIIVIIVLIYFLIKKFYKKNIS